MQHNIFLLANFMLHNLRARIHFFHELRVKVKCTDAITIWCFFEQIWKLRRVRKNPIVPSFCTFEIICRVVRSGTVQFHAQLVEKMNSRSDVALYRIQSRCNTYLIRFTVRNRKLSSLCVSWYDALDFNFFFFNIHL